MGTGWLSVPRDWLDSFGAIGKFCGRILRDVFGRRVLRFFGEALRQAGILIISSAIVIWGLVFIIGLQCGIEGAYFTRAPGHARLCRRVLGVVRSARAGALRLRLHDGRQGGHGDRGRAGLDAHLRRDRRPGGHGDPLRHLPVRHAPARRLAGAALRVHRRRRRRLLRLLPGGGRADRRGVVRRVLPHLLDVPEPTRPALQRDQGRWSWPRRSCSSGCYYGYHAGGGPVGVGTATAKSMVANIVLVHLIGMLGTQVFWGANPRAPIGG